MWIILMCVAIFLAQGTKGSVLDQMAEATQLCCNQGTMYAWNNSAGDCSLSVTPDVPPNFGSLCIFAMDGCCKEYIDKRKDCESGIDLAIAKKSCSFTKDTKKKCCDQCMAGTSMGMAKGASACTISVQDKLAEKLLVGDAFSQCCKNAAALEESRHSTTVLRKPVIDNLTSICEDYAPNELCAHHCIPIPGSYKCECKPGYMLMPDRKNCKEVAINRCKPHNPCQHKCNDNGIQVKCSCRRGYQLKSDGKSCEDIDECTLDPPVCLPDTECHNVKGSYKCIPVKTPKSNQEKGQCPAGFAKNVLNNACDDINECKLRNPPCPSYLCKNTVGGYTCGGMTGDPGNVVIEPPPATERCPPGYKSDFGEECKDVDECAIGENDCNMLSQFCINTRGSFFCQDKGSKHCNPGFKINPTTNKCEDINECEEEQDICRPDQLCVNVPGQYDCKSKTVSRSNEKCPDGLRMNPDSKMCEDIDECVEGTHICDQYQKCLNTYGSHTCHCKVGFKMDHMTGACSDINECATGQNNCIPQSQRCDNTVGSFVCIRFIPCGTGYTMHHSSGACEDIDECALGQHNCGRAGPEYQCVNIPGTFRCTRRPAPAAPSATPEYDYVYYDSEEDIEDGDKKINETMSVSVATTTVIPTTIKTVPIVPTTVLTTEEAITKTTTRQEDNIDNNVIIDTYYNEHNKPTPAFPEPTPPERIPHITNTETSDRSSGKNEVHVDSQPNIDEDKQKTELNEINKIIPPEPTLKPASNSENRDIPDDSSASQTTYSPILDRQTPLKVVYVNVGEETATIKAEKGDDGSVLVDTKDVPKNTWTRINEKPTDCQIGFELDSYGACYDIDECATNKHSCSGLTEVCHNTIGGYLCDCASHFRRDLITGACVLSIPPTPLPPPTTSTTTSTSTSTTTSTTTTTTTTTTPAPTTVSTRSDEWGYTEYRKTPPPFRPRYTCDVGYHHNSETGNCEDIDECENGQANCAFAEQCFNTEGGYRCECFPNWKLDPIRHRCVPARSNAGFPSGFENKPAFNPVDINKVIHDTKGVKKIVEPERTPLDVGGSVYKCKWGTRLGDNNVCEDIDECATGEAQCGPLQTCINLQGGYTCSCLPGHRLVGDHECEDVDECTLGDTTLACSQHAECINTVGSYHCKCHEGFQSAPINDKVCIDVDECSASRPGTLCQQRCNNVWGGYKCSCHKGYRLNADNRTCTDVDECKEFKDKAICVGRCNNVPGSFYCSCPTGYRQSLDKRSCIDIDECESGDAWCANGDTQGGNNVCINIHGGFRCHTITCPPGYRLEDKHRCNRLDLYCAPNDWECAKQPSTYSYNFINFVSNLYMPNSQVDLFQMRGPNWTNAQAKFQLTVVDVNAPPSVKKKADKSSFSLSQVGNQGILSLIHTLEGPQSIELELSMTLYSDDRFGGTVVAKVFIFVSEYEF